MLKEKIPLLKDHHTHPSQYAAFLDSLDIQHIKDKERAVSALKDLDTDDISIVTGWNSGYYRFTNEELNNLSPVVICNLSFHQFAINEKARSLLRKEYPILIENIKNQNWIERNLPNILKNLTEIKLKDERPLMEYFNTMLKKGVWYAEEMLLPNEIILEYLRKVELLSRTKLWTTFDVYKKMKEKNKKIIEGVKVFTDGALGSTTAKLKGNYKDGSNGILLYSDNELKDKLKRIFKLKLRPAIHAIGDMATEQTVLVLKELEKEGFDVDNTRIEHCQFIDKNIANMAKDLGIVLCMQPNFNFDSEYYKDRLTKYYQHLNNPFRMLIDEIGFNPGEDLIFGSDGMPHGVEKALDASFFPPYPSQRLELHEFEEGYCINKEKHGHIEIDIDEENKQVFTEINLNVTNKG